MKNKFDVLIVGGGLVGSLLGLALGRRTSLSVAIIESQSALPTWDENTYHPRVSAISLATQRILAFFNVWDEIKEKRISPFEQIHVWDAHSTIEFDSHDIDESLLGWIIENNLIHSVLYEKIKKQNNIRVFSNITLEQIQENETSVELIDTSNNIFSGKIAIAADGIHSWLRQQSDIAIETLDYDECAIVTEVQTALPHERIARQVFGPLGPLAFLPLNENNMCSIVWSLPTRIAQQKMAQDEAAFKLSLANYFSQQLGEITEIKTRHQFPLIKQYAKDYVKGRVILVGDAAHAIHPLAGQGVNMGMLDAAALCEVMENALAAGDDIANPRYMRRYQRWRKADNFALISGIDIIKKFFAVKSMRPIKTLGINLSNQMPVFKNFFMSYAVGNRDHLPIAAKRG